MSEIPLDKNKVEKAFLRRSSVLVPVAVLVVHCSFDGLPVLVKFCNSQGSEQQPSKKKKESPGYWLTGNNRHACRVLIRHHSFSSIVWYWYVPQDPQVSRNIHSENRVERRRRKRKLLVDTIWWDQPTRDHIWAMRETKHQ